MKKKSNAGKVGLGVAAAAAAAAGAYYLYGSKDAAKNRKKATTLVKKTGAQIGKQAKKGIKLAKAKAGEIQEKMEDSNIVEELAKEIKKAKKVIEKLKEE